MYRNYERDERLFVEHGKVVNLTHVYNTVKLMWPVFLRSLAEQLEISIHKHLVGVIIKNYLIFLLNTVVTNILDNADTK